MKRRAFLIGIAVMLTAHVAASQESRTVKKLGILAPWPPPPEMDADPFRMRLSAAFHDELRNHGWIEGQNLVIERRWAAGRNDLLPTRADLVVE